MRVQLIASTQFHGVDGFTPDDTLPADDAQHVIEAAGRVCYRSFHKPNPATRSNADYLSNVLAQKHFSVIEHASASVLVTGVSRNCTHELVRHRHFSFSEVSGRFIDSGALDVVVPPAMSEYEAGFLKSAFRGCQLRYAAAVEEFKSQGVKGKRAREAARAYLPGSTETAIVVSGNFRSWMEFLLKRDDEAADAEIRLVAQQIGLLLEVLAPNVFGVPARKLWSGNVSQGEPRVVV